jgi:hypothetical protein
MCIKRFKNAAQAWLCLSSLFIAAGHGQIQMMNIPFVGSSPAVPGAGGRVNLPYTVSDPAGGMWFIYNDGALRQQMGPAVFAQGGMLTLDGNNFNAPNNQGTIDAKTTELVLENQQMNGLSVTRRILFDKDDSYVRYIDIIHNSGNQDRAVNVGLQTVLNWGVQQSELVPDPKHKDQNLAWTGMTGMGKCVLEVYGGSGGKNIPTISYQNGNNVIQTNCAVVVPAGKDAAILHLHLFVQSVDAGVKFVNDLKMSKLLKGLPSALRRQIVNFAAGDNGFADLEILRGDVFDVVELRGGDQFKGTLRESGYNLTGFYGSVDLAADRVVAMNNVGLAHPRQLVVTSDGEIFGGHLDKQTIDIALTSGQVISIPLSQISRVGYRKRADEPEEWNLDKPMVLMRGGDRVAVLPPAEKIAVATRYGPLDLDASTVAAIVFQGDETVLHDIYLIDGSKFAGLVSVDALEMHLSGAGPDQSVRFPISGMARLQLGKAADTEADNPSLLLVNQDQLVGSLEGDLKLETTFDTIDLDGRQIRHMGRTDDGTQVTLWDGSTITGQIVESTVPCRLQCGVLLNVPASLLKEYNQPYPQPSADTVKQIEATAADLNADDWRQRDRAEAQLTAMGPAVIGVLRNLRSQAAPEAQQRIDAIIKQLQTPSAHQPAMPGLPQ